MRCYQVVFSVISIVRYRPKSLRSGFKKSRESGMSEFRAVLISGPPGIGKTTSAHLCARAAGLTVVELNASDTRSRKLIKVS